MRTKKFVLMNRIVFCGLLCLSLFSCKKDDETTDLQIAKEYYSQSFNYTVFVDIEREGFHFISMSTGTSYVGDFHQKTYMGCAKSMFRESEESIVRDIEREISTGKGLPKNEDVECYVYFEDTCIYHKLNAVDNVIIIR